MGASMLGQPSNIYRTAINATADGEALPLGSPCLVAPLRTNGAGVMFPDGNCPTAYPNAMAQFAGILVRELPSNPLGDQHSSSLIVEGLVKANLLIPSTGADVVPGAHLIPTVSGGVPCLTPVAYSTGIRLVEDKTALVDGALSKVEDGGGAWVEIVAGATFGMNPRLYLWAAPATASASAYKTGQASSTAITTITDFSGWTLDGIPDYPRNLVITPTGTTTDVAAGDVVVTGKDCEGNVITETFTFAENASTATTGVKAFAEITGVVIHVQDGAGATWSFGSGVLLGIGHCFGSDPCLVEARADGTIEATNPTLVGDVDDVESNTVSFNTAPDGSVVPERSAVRLHDAGR